MKKLMNVVPRHLSCFITTGDCDWFSDIPTKCERCGDPIDEHNSRLYSIGKGRDVEILRFCNRCGKKAIEQENARVVIE